MERPRLLLWSGWIEINARLRHFPSGLLFFDLRQRGREAPRPDALEGYRLFVSQPGACAVRLGPKAGLDGGRLIVVAVGLSVGGLHRAECALATLTSRRKCKPLLGGSPRGIPLEE
jgi:hypothetical protein